MYLRSISVVVGLSVVLFSTSCIFEEDIVQEYDPNNHTAAVLTELVSTFEFDSITFKYIPVGEYAKTLIVEIADDFEKSSARGLTNHQQDVISSRIFETLTRKERAKILRYELWHTNKYQYDRFFSINEMKSFVYSFRIQDDQLIPAYIR